MAHDERSHGGEPPPPFWEWVVAGIGLLLLLASVGFLLYDAQQARGAQPRPEVVLLGVEAQGAQFLVRVEARNAARASAAALRVAGELRRGDALVEAAEVEFDYLPGLSSRRGAMLFRNDPRLLQLHLAARSWREP